MRRALAAVALIVLALTGCSSSDQQSTAPGKSAAPSGSQSSPSEHATTGSASKGEVIDVTIAGDRIEPNGQRVKVAVGQPITLRVRSDRAAELHVHSSPEQELEVKKGESTVRFTIKTPGIVEVEEHHSGVVLLQLEVS